MLRLGRKSDGDHPRMCGEHGLIGEVERCSRGSSPHVRGALDMQIMVDRIDGIIPACAGSTACIFLRLSVCWDHLRMCGEHYSYVVHPAEE